MAVDNDVYNRLGRTWWDDDNPLVVLHGSMTAGRVSYFRSVLACMDQLPDGTAALAAPDIGSGGGFLAEEFCRLGFRVTGVEPSEVSVRTARAHAAAAGLDIDYRLGSGERLPVVDAAFDVAYCCDVLEHVTDVDRVLAETARALRPGGVYLFDTPNRTLASKLVTKATQQWRLTRIVDFQGPRLGDVPAARGAGRARPPPRHQRAGNRRPRSAGQRPDEGRRRRGPASATTELPAGQRASRHGPHPFHETVLHGLRDQELLDGNAVGRRRAFWPARQVCSAARGSEGDTGSSPTMKW
jgi:ubiquinone biosynthesis O-methyltransferase